jgi:hypothetical protein
VKQLHLDKIAQARDGLSDLRWGMKWNRAMGSGWRYLVSSVHSSHAPWPNKADRLTAEGL